MAEAIALARRGLFTTMPNPRVGCVLARDGSVVGRGWHAVAGGPHAEIDALASAGEAARGATAYVTLEPCAHEGRTGPCAEALVQAGVAAVVVAHRDPNPRVDGGGLERLQAAGIETRTGLLASEARRLNPGFLSRMERGRPWVRIKLAQSLDGCTALKNGASQWITGAAARQDVQRWRGRADAVLTGVGTVLADDPSLDLRLEGVDRQPLRVIVDSTWRTPPGARTLGLDGDVLVVGRDDIQRAPGLEAAGAECLALPARDRRVDLERLMAELAAREINEVHVEAGGTLCGSLLQQGLVDDIVLYQASCLLGHEGLPTFRLDGIESMAHRPELRVMERVAVGDDLRIRLRPQYSGNREES